MNILQKAKKLNDEYQVNYNLERKYNYFDGDKDKNFNISKMYGYVKDKRELDKFLEKYVFGGEANSDILQRYVDLLLKDVIQFDSWQCR